MDLGFNGLPYTWDNRQGEDRNVKVRLDRALGDHKFMELFPDTSATHVPLVESDHCALVIEMHRRQRSTRRRRRRRVFRYENMWQRHHLYNDTVAAAWNEGCTSLAEVNAELGFMQSTLIRWDREEFGSVKGELRNLRRQLESIRSRTIGNGPAPEER